MKVLNLRRKHQFLGPEDDEGYKWAVQDDVIYYWSESNVCYCDAWWLDKEGNPVTDGPPSFVEHAAQAAEQTGFDPSWLNNPR